MTAPAPLPRGRADCSPRFLPVVGDAMAPALNHTHVVAVVPVDGYRGPGLYVLDVHGQPEVMRCEALSRDELRVTRDNPAYSGFTVPREWFEGALLGQVAAVCQVIDRTLLERA